MAAGYTARKFCYKACCHLDVPVTVMLGRVNEASLLELLNCVALLTSLERATKDLCCFSIITNMRFRRLQACCETAIQEVLNWVKWLEHESDNKPLYNVEITSGAIILSFYMSVRCI
jgi:hypothetical protein